MDTVLNAVDDVARLLNAKGYNGLFQVNADFPGKIEASLMKYLQASLTSDENGLKKDMVFTTYLDWKDPDHDYVKAYMIAKYIAGKIYIKNIDATHHDCYGTILNRENYDVNGTDTLPHSSQVVETLKTRFANHATEYVKPQHWSERELRKLRYENLIPQAVGFAKLLKRAGYDEIFTFSPSDIKATAEHGLKGLATIWKFSEVREIPKISMLAELYKSGRNERIQCRLDVRFDDQSGFGIEAMNITHQYKDKLKELHYHLADVKNIPLKPAVVRDMKILADTKQSQKKGAKI